MQKKQEMDDIGCEECLSELFSHKSGCFGASLERLPLVKPFLCLIPFGGRSSFHHFFPSRLIGSKDAVTGKKSIGAAVAIKRYRVNEATGIAYVQ